MAPGALSKEMETDTLNMSSLEEECERAQQEAAATLGDMRGARQTLVGRMRAADQRLAEARREKEMIEGRLQKLRDAVLLAADTAAHAPDGHVKSHVVISDIRAKLLDAVDECDRTAKTIAKSK